MSKPEPTFLEELQALRKFLLEEMTPDMKWEELLHLLTEGDFIDDLADQLYQKLGGGYSANGDGIEVGDPALWDSCFFGILEATVPEYHDQFVELKKHWTGYHTRPEFDFPEV